LEQLTEVQNELAALAADVTAAEGDVVRARAEADLAALEELIGQLAPEDQTEPTGRLRTLTTRLAQLPTRAANQADVAALTAPAGEVAVARQELAGQVATVRSRYRRWRSTRTGYQTLLGTDPGAPSPVPLHTDGAPAGPGFVLRVAFALPGTPSGK